MKKENYGKDILEYLEQNNRTQLKPRKLARAMGISDDEYGTFRAAYKQLRDSGRLVLGSDKALTIPEHPSSVIGRFQASPKGFGFVVPDDPGAHGDLYVPPENTGGAMNGDRVVAAVLKRGKRQGQMRLVGDIREILERGSTILVGTLQRTGHTCFIVPDGKQGLAPAIVHNAPSKAKCPAGTKVAARIVEYPDAGDMPVVEIENVLGRSGELKAETAAALVLFGLKQEFESTSIKQAQQAVAQFDPSQATDRLDLREKLIITIDPVDARDFDDAVSLDVEDGKWILGVHIADVSHFVPPGTDLDQEAALRGTSVYFPGSVVPMLPESVSNGICSLSPNDERYTLSAFITYDSAGHVLERALHRSVIQSKARLNYGQAADIIGGKTTAAKLGFAEEVQALLGSMSALTQKILARRQEAGMLHLDLPEIQLELDDEQHVQGARPYELLSSHRMIEMFMVEANEAVAELLTQKKLPFIRRIHPEPTDDSLARLSVFLRACGQTVPKKPSQRDLQTLIAGVREETIGYALNLSVLRSLERAVYHVDEKGHYALASEHYCHFTSPIRRYADLTVHRAICDHLIDPRTDAVMDEEEQRETAKHLTLVSQRAESAERHVKQTMVLHYLSNKVDETFVGIVTGVTDFGLFVQHPIFLIEGLLRLDALGDDWWEVLTKEGEVCGEASGKRYRIGDQIEVQIAAVEVAHLKLDLRIFQKDNPTGRGSGRSVPESRKSSPRPKRKQPMRSGSKTHRSNRSKSRKR